MENADAVGLNVLVKPVWKSSCFTYSNFMIKHSSESLPFPYLDYVQNVFLMLAIDLGVCLAPLVKL